LNKPDEGVGASRLGMDDLNFLGLFLDAAFPLRDYLLGPVITLQKKTILHSDKTH
jgi:hypothetical protein